MQAQHGPVEDVLDPRSDDRPTGGAHRLPETAEDEATQVDEPGEVPSPDVADAPAGTPVDPTAERLDRIEASLAETNRMLRDGAERAAARERVIDRQHAEIERLKAVERVGALRPVVVELCRLRNDLLRQARTLRPDTSAERFAGLLESFAGSVTETLEQCGVEPLPLEPGIPFVPQRHRVASVVPTADPGRDGTVADVVADGYVETDGGKVVAPARVVLHRLDDPAPATGDPAGIGDPDETAATLPTTTREETTDD